MTSTPTPLACPHCRSTRLRSDEVAAIGYPVTLTRDAAGAVSVDYTGDGYTVFDEGTTYSGDIWCRDCGEQLAEADLIPDRDGCGEVHPDDSGYPLASGLGTPTRNRGRFTPRQEIER